jgi:amino acid transporter
MPYKTPQEAPVILSFFFFFFKKKKKKRRRRRKRHKLDMYSFISNIINKIGVFLDFLDKNSWWSS